MSSYEEWRVTGAIYGEPYEFTWSPMRNPHLGDPAAAARAFVELDWPGVAWTDGPHLSHRTVTVTEWEAA